DFRRNPLRRGLHRDDARLRLGRGARLPGLADRPPLAVLARAPARSRLRLRALAVGPLRRRSRLLVALGARRLGAPFGGGTLDRRARPACVRRLAQGSRAAPNGLPALLEA